MKRGGEVYFASRAQLVFIFVLYLQEGFQLDFPRIKALPNKGNYMRNILISTLVLFSTASASAWTGYCARYTTSAESKAYLTALSVVAKNLQYTEDQMCTLPTLSDIHLAKRNFVNAQQEIESHVWVTLHYSEYSCQYFVRESDWVVTRKNCYNTW